MFVIGARGGLAGPGGGHLGGFACFVECGRAILQVAAPGAASPCAARPPGGLRLRGGALAAARVDAGQCRGGRVAELDGAAGFELL